MTNPNTAIECEDCIHVKNKTICDKCSISQIGGCFPLENYYVQRNDVRQLLKEQTK